MAGNIVEEINECEFNKITEKGIAVVDFFAEWCMPCLMISPMIEDLSEKIKGVKFAKVDVDDNKNLAEKFNVMSIPCIIFFKDGKEIGRSIGAVPQDVLEEKIQALR